MLHISHHILFLLTTICHKTLWFLVSGYDCSWNTWMVPFRTIIHQFICICIVDLHSLCNLSEHGIVLERPCDGHSKCLFNPPCSARQCRHSGELVTFLLVKFFQC